MINFKVLNQKPNAIDQRADMMNNILSFAEKSHNNSILEVF